MLPRITIIFLSLCASIINCQKPSPCPEVFSYEPRGSEQDRWYGSLTIQSNENLQGVWLRIFLDRPADLVGNWFGDVSSTDNTEFLIKNSKYSLQVGPPVQVRFFVKYNAAAIIPSVRSVRLNGKLICSSDEINTTVATLHLSRNITRTSTERSRTRTTERGTINIEDVRPHKTRTSSTTNSPSSNINTGNYNIINLSSLGTDHFIGDFPVANRPQNAQTSLRPARPSRFADCGRAAAQPTALIFNGQKTVEGQWPWHAAVYVSENTQLKYICGGSLISPNHILTAGHCVTMPKRSTKVNADTLTIYLGKHKLSKFGQNVQDREVTEIFLHPEYNATHFYNDIAILKLDRDVDYTNFVRPVCLWEGNEELEPYFNQLGTVVGWGFDENRQLSEGLAQTQMPIVTPLTCIYSNRDFFSHALFEKNYCAGFRNGTMVCNGDSGGGMVLPRGGSSGQNTVWQIRGVVSIGVALQSNGQCDPSHYAIFTDVAKYVDWIKRIINN